MGDNSSGSGSNSGKIRPDFLNPMRPENSDMWSDYGADRAKAQEEAQKRQDAYDKQHPNSSGGK